MIHSRKTPASRFLGFGSYLPQKVLSNDDLSGMMDTSDEWIYTRTGIRTRHQAAPEETTASLGAIAASRAIEDAGLEPNDIDLIIMGTMFPDFSYPGPGMVIKEECGITKTAPVIDIRVQCPGFVFGMSMADLYIASGQAQNVLLVFSEKQFDHFKVDRQTGVIFGDGAGAAVMGPSVDNRGIYVMDIQGDGQGVQDMVMTSDCIVDLYKGEAVWPKELQQCKTYWEEKGMTDGFTKYPFWIGQEVFKNAVRRLVKSVKGVLAETDWSSSDMAYFFLHQANARINAKLIELLKLDKDKVPSNIEKIGNTGAASIPILMTEYKKAGLLEPGMPMIISAFGAGYLWGSSVVTF